MRSLRDTDATGSRLVERKRVLKQITTKEMNTRGLSILSWKSLVVYPNIIPKHSKSLYFIPFLNSEKHLRRRKKDKKRGLLCNAMKGGKLEPNTQNLAFWLVSCANWVFLVVVLVWKNALDLCLALSYFPGDCRLCADQSIVIIFWVE